MTGKDILECTQSSKSIINTDSDGEKASPVLQSSEMRNIMKKQCEVYLQKTSSFEPLSNIKDNTPALVTHSKVPQHINLRTFNDDRFQVFRGTKLAGREFVTTSTRLLCSQIFY
ncbi:hypothetical protein TNCV_3740501 [Trichonephila clavipes]|nr:hypothetical protein TNCV_3740501 [Trichonephila clavipes]